MIGGINMVVAFTGYRPEKMPFVESKKDEAYLKFRKRQLQVIERLIERGCTHFISGVAMGFDTWVAEDILALQKNNSSLELECAIPFPGQADRWSTSDQKRRYKILTHAKKPPTDRLIPQLSHGMFYLSVASTCLAFANWLCTPISRRDLQARLNLALFQPGMMRRSPYSFFK